jgi:hypothetical protein
MYQKRPLAFQVCDGFRFGERDLGFREMNAAFFHEADASLAGKPDDSRMWQARQDPRRMGSESCLASVVATCGAGLPYPFMATTSKQ